VAFRVLVMEPGDVFLTMREGEARAFIVHPDGSISEHDREWLWEHADQARATADGTYEWDEPGTDAPAT
jgi:hypothetical protein